MIRPRAPRLTCEYVDAHRTGSPALARRGLFGADIERYSSRSAPDQYEAQRTYEWALRRAARDAGIGVHTWLRQPAGDGEFAVLPEGVHEPRVIAVLLSSVAARLREYNQRHISELRVRLRVAVHHGLVQLDGATGCPGRHPVIVARLLDSGPVRDLLQSRPGINLAAIISDEVYQDVVLNRYEDLRPELFRAVYVNNPAKEFAAPAWLYSPEEDVTR